jgi:hypothetical protein
VRVGSARAEKATLTPKLRFSMASTPCRMRTHRAECGRIDTSSHGG